MEPLDRCRCQCFTIPIWDRVKPMKTPTANSGTSSWVSPRTAMSSSAAAIASTMTP